MTQNSAHPREGGEPGLPKERLTLYGGTAFLLLRAGFPLSRERTGDGRGTRSGRARDLNVAVALDYHDGDFVALATELDTHPRITHDEIA